MISEIDIRDWEKVDFKKVHKALDEIDFENMHPPQWEHAYTLEIFIKQMELLKENQIKQATKHVPAIFKKGEE